MHVPFEDPGAINDWAEEKGHRLNFSHLYLGEHLPDIKEPDFLVIMGGPMNVYDFHVHPWMEEEQSWVKSFIESGKPVLGICLGAQLIASALGAEVYPGPHKEIGWFNLEFLPAFGDFMITGELPSSRKVFHWHGDTFAIPEGATHIASSRAFPNQAFIYNENVIALQFHLEVDKGMVKDMVKNCGDELVPGPHIQSATEITASKQDLTQNRDLLYKILEYLLK